MKKLNKKKNVQLENETLVVKAEADEEEAIMTKETSRVFLNLIALFAKTL